MNPLGETVGTRPSTAQQQATTMLVSFEFLFLAENSKLERVINLLSCFLVTLLCICGTGCVVRNLGPKFSSNYLEGKIS